MNTSGASLNTVHRVLCILVCMNKPQCKIHVNKKVNEVEVEEKRT